MVKLEALLIGGQWPLLMMATLGLLSRAGFTVDVISTNAFFKKNKSMRGYFLAEEDSIFAKLASEKLENNYTMVVIGDDPALGKILHSELSDEDKLELLPVMSQKNFDHIFSKIGLSLVFDSNGINTPDYRAVQNERELMTSARELGYPMLVKIDSSAGGIEVFECQCDKDLEGLAGKLRNYPVLAQQKIKGIEVSVEAFYQKGVLIHFAYSIPLESKYKFGPSTVRRYMQRALLDEKVFDNLHLVGKALGADGFVNIGSILAEHDKTLYFFEADMRPNLWIGYSRYFGDDPAQVIHRHFSTVKTVPYPPPFNPDHPGEILLPHFLRIKFRDLLLNRHHVWRYLPQNFLYFMLRYKIWASIRSTPVKLHKLLLTKHRRVIPNIIHGLRARLIQSSYGNSAPHRKCEITKCEIKNDVSM